MYYDRVTRTVHLEIGGEEYLLRFSLNVLEQLESRSDKNFLDTVTSGGMPPLSMLVDGFWLGLMGAGKRIKREEAEKLAETFMSESDEGVGTLAKLFTGLLAISGLFGAKYSHDALKRLGITDKDDELVKEPKEKKKDDGSKNAGAESK
nr:MAG TPA: tail assembly chaperone protein [Caudoviricetes sp.]